MSTPRDLGASHPLTHSPLPFDATDFIMNDGTISITDADDCIVASVLPAFIDDQSIQADNAELLVHRVNLHDPLVNALKLLLTDVENGTDHGMPFEDADHPFHKSVTAARAVLAQTHAVKGAGNAMAAFVRDLAKLGFGDEDADINGGDTVEAINQHFPMLLGLSYAAQAEPDNAELVAALEASTHMLHTFPDGPCKCSQCDFVRLRDAALAKARSQS